MSFKIIVNSIPAEGMEFEKELPATELNLETEEIQYLSPVTFKVSINKDQDIIMVNCHATGNKRNTCGRCLEEFDIPLEKDMDFIYEIEGEHSIELDDNIRDSIVLDYPMRALCKPECKGLCPRCGKNLNEGPCDCELKD